MDEIIARPEQNDEINISIEDDEIHVVSEDLESINFANTDAIVNINTGEAMIYAQGERGTEGKKGQKGDKGDTATIRIGSVETGLPGTLAEVTNSGTESDAIFPFKIPRGYNGDGYAGAEYDEGNKAIIFSSSEKSLGSMAFINDAPNDGRQYVRQNGQWVAL